MLSRAVVLLIAVHATACSSESSAGVTDAGADATPPRCADKYAIGMGLGGCTNGAQRLSSIEQVYGTWFVVPNCEGQHLGNCVLTRGEVTFTQTSTGPGATSGTYEATFTGDRCGEFVSSGTFRIEGALLAADEWSQPVCIKDGTIMTLAMTLRRAYSPEIDTRTHWEVTLARGADAPPRP
jgi:hypothetical protein